jgi:hypothetical protein
VELEKTAKLIKYYLASEKAQRAADYQPTDWELLTPDEQRVEIREEERIANLLLWNSVKRDYKESRRQLLAELRAKRLAKSKRSSFTALSNRNLALIHLLLLRRTSVRYF